MNKRQINQLNPEDYAVTDTYLVEHTAKYPMLRANVNPVQLIRVPDILSGGTRFRHYGATLSVGILPNLDRMQEPVMIGADIPLVMVDADTLEDLKARLLAEIEMIFKVYEEQVKPYEGEEGHEEGSMGREAVGCATEEAEG